MELYRLRIDGRSKTGEERALARRMDEIERKLRLAGLRAERSALYRIARSTSSRTRQPANSSGKSICWRPASERDDETWSRSARCEQLGGFYSAKEEFNGDDAVLSYLTTKERTMKLTTIGLATAFTLSSTFALAQAPGLGGYGSVVAPSVGSYVAPSVGSTNVVPTWRNTGPAAPLPRVPTVRNTFRNSIARMRVRSRSTVPTIRASGVHR
jgi:hypothetical protein